MKKVWLIALSTVAISFGFLATPLRAQFAYVVNALSNNVSAYSIGSNGALTPVPGSPFPAGHTPGKVAVDPTGQFAYVVNGSNNVPGSGAVSAFSIGSNGVLTPVPGSPFPAGSSPVSVTVDPTGKFAYVANFSNTVSAFSIGSNGALTPVPGSPFPAGLGPESVAVDPTGKFAYVANISSNVPGSGTVSAFSIGSNGVLTPVPGSPFPAGFEPLSVTVDPTGKFAYVANEFSNNVSAYSIGSNGALTPVPGSPFATIQEDPVSVAVDPTGQFAYVADFGISSGTNGVSAYSIGSNGVLTPVPGSAFATGNGPTSVAVDPTGKFAYVVDFQIPSGVSGYSIGSNGALTPIPGSPFATGDGPVTIAITPEVPFAASFAKLEIEARHRPGFELEEFFTLGTNSNGIDPVTENVTLQIGTFSVTIPASSFEQDPNGRFEFEGVINGVSLEVQIAPLGNNIFTFKAEGKGVDLTDLTNPVTVVLTIGTDSGTTAVTAEFENRKEHHKQEHAKFAPDFSGDNG
jgi:DNA-binding beta-propeller fold protein YncE